MIKLIYSFIIVCTCIGTSAQISTNLEDIAHELSSFRNYRSICKYTFSLPFGDTLMFESLIVLQKAPKNNLSEFNYNFEVTENYRGELFGDFSMYFDSAVYNSYQGVIEKTCFSENPSQFTNLEIDIGIVPAIQQRHVLYSVTPYILSEEIENFIMDTTFLISQETDTIIQNDTCLRFLVKVEKRKSKLTTSSNLTKDYNQLIEMCFNKSGLYPVYYKKDIRNSKSNSFIIASFKNSETDFAIGKNYFTEENLLLNSLTNTEELQENKSNINLVGKKAPKWNLPILGKDKKYSSNSIHGKYALLEFTATWCAHCWEAAKMMNRLELEFENNENIELISIYSSNVDDKESIEKFVKVLNPISIILYSASSVGEQYNVSSYPNFFIISPEGKILEHLQGYGPSIEKGIINTLTNIAE